MIQHSNDERELDFAEKMRQLFLSTVEEDGLACDNLFAESQLMGGSESNGGMESMADAWSADNNVGTIEILDETSRDSGICMMDDATPGGDSTQLNFSFSTLSNASMSGAEDSFSELMNMPSFPVSLADAFSVSPQAACGGDGGDPSRVSRVLTDRASSPLASPCFSARAKVKVHRRRHQRHMPSAFEESPSLPGHVIEPPSIDSCIVEADERADLIGDMSTTHVLPLQDNFQHDDLKTISSDTLAAVINNDYAAFVDDVRIIDCRYPYEFDGGHIDGARNICTKDALMSELMPAAAAARSSTSQTSPASKRTALIFHCEFSSERAPKLLRFLRNQDRAAHAECYPRLRYPELYLLAGGYKAFYEVYSSLCCPMSYRPMLHADHADELRHFRVKSKTWAGDRKHSRIPSAPRSLTARRHSLQL